MKRKRQRQPVKGAGAGRTDIRRLSKSDSTPPARTVLLKRIAKANAGIATIKQRARMSVAMEVMGSITTIEAVRYLDIIRPGARIAEMRNKFGMNIKTLWTREPTEAGELHRVARYVKGDL